MNNLDDDFYVFCAPKDDPNSNSHIKIIDPDSPAAGMIFVVNWVKVRKKYFDLFGPYVLSYHYTILCPPEGKSFPENTKAYDPLVGVIIEDVWAKYY